MNETNIPAACFCVRIFAYPKEIIMIRKIMFALATVVALGTVAIPSAEARGFGGGGFQSGYRGWGPGIGLGVGLGLLGAGLYGAYAYAPGYYGYGYPQRIWTPYGWRLRQVCGY
jgi:hypothetical protein